MISTLGRYKIVAEIGQGAMGVVYKAVDPIIDRTVAIKTINLNLSRQELEEYEARFQQEIKAAGRLNHPNIVTIYDVGKTDQVAYMAMEFLDGKSLRQIITEQSPIDPLRVLRIVIQCCASLSEAHNLGITGGWLLKSEVRATEKLPTIEGIDDAPAGNSSPAGA